MSAWTYAPDGSRRPFDPRTTAAGLDGCILCAGPAVMVGIFMPATDAMRAVALRLRQHALRPNSTPAIAYALCAGCVEEVDVTSMVEAALVAAAAKVVIQ